MKGDEYIAAFELSKNVINYLHETYGDSYRKIGRKIEMSCAHISRVIHKEKGLSLERLIQLANSYTIPLPVLLSEAMKKGHS